MKKVLIHDRRTVEVWYGLPNSSQVSRPGDLAPRDGLFSELKVGAMDNPGLKFAVGYTFN